MSKDFIPAGEGEFADWAANFVNAAGEEGTNVGLSADKVTALNAKYQAWITARTDRNTKQSALDSAIQTTQTARETLTTELRDAASTVQRHGGTTDALRRRFRVTVAGDTAAPSGPPTSWPVFTLSAAGPLRLEAAFRDSASTTSKAKPAGALGAEIWIKVGGAAPTQESEMHFLGLDTKSPYLHEAQPNEIGQAAHIRGRWITSKGEKGPWGPVTTITISQVKPRKKKARLKNSVAPFCFHF